LNQLFLSLFMNNTNSKIRLEFVVLMASLMSIVALSIDAILPALSDIGLAIHSQSPADNQLLIIMIFMGLGVGQLLFGPLSDSFGRKPIVYFGLILFFIASLICVFSKSLELMVFGRLLQGIALSAPRTISISIVRDSYKGDHMARIMSFVMVIFILVPVLAPALGKLILDYYNWQAIFYAQLVFAGVVGIWFWKRQPETLKKEYKAPFSNHLFVDGLRELLKFRETLVFTVISGFVTGAFMVYLSSSQHIFENQYGLKEEFPYIFAGLAITVGLATFSNGALVMRFGMRKLVLIALISYCCISISYILLFWSTGNPSLTVLLSFMALQFFAIGFLFGNINAIAMEPIGHIAGIGAAIIGFASMLIAVPLAIVIGQFVNATVLPMFVGFSACGVASLSIFVMVMKKKC